MGGGCVRWEVGVASDVAEAGKHVFVLRVVYEVVSRDGISGSAHATGCWGGKMPSHDSPPL